MKIWLLWAWMVGVVWSQELPWDYSSWKPILNNCPTCREGKKLEIRQANLEQLSFKPVSVRQQKSIFPLAKATSIPKLDKTLTKDLETAAQTTAIQAQRSSVQHQIFQQQQRAAKQKHSTKVFPLPLVHSEQVLQPIQKIDFSDKVKRDQDGRVVLGGNPNALTNTLPMTLVTLKGQEADAQAKLALLEAALTSHQPNHQQNGRLPRIFIAPSHVPPPPGYVKIALVPQADAATQPRDSLPQTFLTPNARNLSPGLVKLDLPHSVSHLSRDIPVVVPNDQVAPNPLGFPHLNPLVARPDASLNIQTPDQVRIAKAISSSSPSVQVVPRGEPQTASRPPSPPPRPTTTTSRPTPSAPQTTARPPPPPPPPQFSRPPLRQTSPTVRPTPSAPQTTARPPPPPPPSQFSQPQSPPPSPQFSQPPPQFQQQQQRFPATPSSFAPRPPFTAFPGAPFPGQQFNGPPRFIPGQTQPFQGQGFPQPNSQFRPGHPFPAPGQPFPAPGQTFPAPAQPFPGSPQQFPGSPQQFPHRFNEAPVQFGQPPSPLRPFRPDHSVFRNPTPTIRPDFPQISEITPKPLPFTTPKPTPTKQASIITPTTPKPTPKPTTQKPIRVTSPRPAPTSTPRILAVTPPLRPTPKAFEAASPNPQIISQGSPTPQFSSVPFRTSPPPQPTPRPFPSSPFPSSPFPSSPFPPSPFSQTSTPGTLPPRPSPQTSPFTNQPTPSPIPSSTPFAPRPPVIPGFQQPERPRFPTFQEAQKPGSFPSRPAPQNSPFTNQPTPSPVPSSTPFATRSPVIPGFQQPEKPRFPTFQGAQNARIPSLVETERPTTTVETQRPKIPSFQIPRKPFQPLFTEPGIPEIGKSAGPEILEAERAGFQSIETSVPTLVSSDKPLIPSFQRPRFQTLKPVKVTSSPVTTTPEPTTTTTTSTSTTTTTTTTVTTPEFTTPSSTTSGAKVTTFKPRFRGVGGRRRPFLRRKPIKRIKKPTTVVEDIVNDEEEKKEENSTLFPPFAVANRINQLRKKEELGGAVEDPRLGVTIPPRGTFGRRIRPRTRAPNSITSTDSNSRSEPVNGRRLPPWLEQRRRARLRTTTTQETPVDDVLENDTPVDIIDNNGFTGAESALVVVSQPAENSAFNYRDVAKTLQEKEKVLRNEQVSVAVKAAEDALLHYAEVVEDEAVIEKDLSAIETLTHSEPVSEIDDEYDVYEPEPEPESAAPEPEPEPTFYDAVYEENTEEVTIANPSVQVIEEESASPEPEPNTEYVDQYFDYEDTLEDTVTTTLPYIDDLKHIPSSKPHLPYSTLVEISLDSHRSDIPIESSLESEYAPVEHDDILVAPSDSLVDQDTLLEADSGTETPLDDVTEQPLFFDTQPQIIIQAPDYEDYYEYDDYVDSFGDGSDQSFGGSVSQVIYAVPASDWSPDDAAFSEDTSAGASDNILGVTDDSIGVSDSSFVSTVPSVATESTPGSSEIPQGVTDQESPKVVEPPAEEEPVTTEVYLGEDGVDLPKTDSPEDLLLLDETYFDDLVTTTIPETTWASFSVKPITITPPTSTPTSVPPKENKLNKANMEEMKWSVRGPKVLSHSTVTESRTSNARVCFHDGTCFDASGIRRRRR